MLELLAPAGDLQCLRAAIENGADSVYFGLDHGFNARHRAANLALEQLDEIMELLHRRGVKGYVTLNTLVFSDEMEELERTARRIAAAGADAVLVQDWGVARLVRDCCPELPLHASTQMTITAAEGSRRLSELGISRIVLARELSLTEIRQIHGACELPLEVFAHGALCVAYSGQCLTSESLGGRSANRGQCAQACRLPYEVVCDQQEVDLGDLKYLLSPQDLAAWELIPELLDAGVTCLKIEGRLKSPEYVASITRRYREAIDAAVNGRPVQFTTRQVDEMELTFSRGFSPGWLQGCDHKMLVPGLSSSKRGVLLGEVVAAGPRRVAVRLRRPLRRGDGVVFEGDRAADAEQGGRVYEIFGPGGGCEAAEAGETVELGFAHGSIDLTQCAPGLKLWKTDDPKLTSELRKSFDSDTPRRRTPLDLRIEAVAGQPLRLEAVADNGAAVALATALPLETARKHPLTLEVLRGQLGRLGRTIYRLRSVEAEIQGEPMAPLSVLGDLRRRLIAALDDSSLAAARSAARKVGRVASEPSLPRLRAALGAASAPQPAAPALHVLCRSLAQIRNALQAGAGSLLADFADIRQYGEAVEACRRAEVRLLLATPRIYKPGEGGVLRSIDRLEPDGVLVRNLAGIEYFGERGRPRVGDFSLNAANELSVEWLMSLGLERVTISYDLNRDQVQELLRHTPLHWLEAVLHQHMPMFHMEHCVFCAVLSPGTNKTNCGRPCDTHQVELRDRVGKLHPLTADVGCRNTLFNATPQSAAEAAPALLASGLRHFRVELLHDASPSEVAHILSLYQRLLRGELTGQSVWTQLQAANRMGVTRGALEERRNPLAVL